MLRRVFYGDSREFFVEFLLICSIDVYVLFAIFSVMFRGMFRIIARGPRVFSISFRFLVSCFVIALLNGEMIRYNIV